MSYFKYATEEINKLIGESGCQKAAMLGVYNDLQRIKPLIEDFYDRYIFNLDRWCEDCGYHGWDWSKDDGAMKSMYKITNGIGNKFQEIYALILAGLGEKCESIEDGNE